METEKKYHHGNLRELLITEGLKMINEEGFESFSLRKLASKLEVSHTAAYRHFCDKDKLLEAIFNDTATKFYTALFESVKDIENPQEKMTKLGIGYVKFFLKNPEMLTIFQLGSKFENTRISVDIDNPKANNSADYFNAFTFFQEIAKNSPKNPIHQGLSDLEILLGFWSKVHGLASLIVSQKKTFDTLSQEQLYAMVEHIISRPF